MEINHNVNYWQKGHQRPNTAGGLTREDSREDGGSLLDGPFQPYEGNRGHSATYHSGPLSFFPCTFFFFFFLLNHDAAMDD